MVIRESGVSPSASEGIPGIAVEERTAAPPDVLDMERLSRDYARTRDPRLRESLILHHQRLVKAIASRFMGAGESLDDLVQVGNIGLINALDRYNPEQGTRFSTYATPTILGEIKRHFRDKTSGIKIPRWLQELHHAARRAGLQMTNELGRAPTLAEIAARLGATEEDIATALESGEAMNLLSLDTRMENHAGVEITPTLLDLVGHLDTALLEFEIYGDLRTAMECLEGREREVIALRFFDELSQAKIAKKLNISQMHVSRLQQRALKRLREMLTDRRRGAGNLSPLH